MIAITTSSSISVNPDERLDSLCIVRRIVSMDCLPENPHLVENHTCPVGGPDVGESKARRAYTCRRISSTVRGDRRRSHNRRLLIETPCSVARMHSRRCANANNIKSYSPRAVLCALVLLRVG